MEDITNEDMVELADGAQSIITVVGVGGAGSNAVNYMWDIGIRNVRFIVCNTDQQSLDVSPIQNRVRLGSDGLGAGNDPEAGREAAVLCLDEIRSRLEAMNTRMMFIAAGMGGGTGTGAAPVIAKLAREMGILTVAIVTSPLKVEGQLRYDQAMAGIELMKESVDSLLIVNNENIKNLYLEDPSAKEAFSKANEILACAAKGIAEIITVKSSYVNVDFADVSRVIRNSGRAHMSVEKAMGENRAVEVARQSLSSPLLDHNHIAGAKNILLNVAVANTDDFKYSELTKILNHIQDNARVTASDGQERTANIIWGMSEKPELGDALELVLVATGFDNEAEEFARYDRDKLLIQSVMGDGDTQHIERVYKAPDVVDNPASRVIVDGDKIILPERAQRYPNIYSMLKVPAYMAHKVSLISESGLGTKRAAAVVDDAQSIGEPTASSSEVSGENSLF
ncbi:MAG: cell division protein FtsZ [Rikenellaceae bacterium]